MRHRKSFNHLSRKAGHRKAMLANMATSLIIHKRIETTTAKAKALRMYVEPLITKSKDDSTHSRRVVFSYLQSKDAVNELFREVSPKVATRPGGYTRILKTGHRLGDNADMCVIELVDYNENLLVATEETKEKATKGRRRRRRGSGKGSGDKAQEQAVTQTAENAPGDTPEESSEETQTQETMSEAQESGTTEETVSEAEVIEEEKTEDTETEAKAEEEESKSESSEEEQKNNEDKDEEKK
jgi:large subunit ribosomal protein L17